ncbi:MULTISPECIES: glutathione synthase [unclassified Vibrio]|uniref:glutathione synthase n=1 Tax=unclassified Vibrio TaxID=2614977 RepID=UPI000C81A815|nr:MULTISPECIES: glutathione synthase [unclassified Vibrio]PMI22432.1 glutathione synthase [Vibrio sp. 10N.286.46.E10]PMI88067.1 glutathione synthase [Vibrio sp. 10N.286.45.E10]PTO98449.1 glutathione synthase [Vibrio sp. 10N.286.48.B8]PTP10032.1 glutathione synthase [Vibrio sp. 10N.286.45.A3]PTQ25311.1 glutathione synthase [Vibrio sp. 10N.286.46.E10]
MNPMPSIPQQVIEDACEWAIMHGVAFRQSDNTARHCPFSLAPMSIERKVFEHLLRVTPLITKLINNVSEDHDFLQSSLSDMAKADPFFGRLMELHQQAHGSADERLNPARQPLLLMRTDFMDDRRHGAKVIEFNGIAAGMAPFGQRATEFHSFMQNQWANVYNNWLEDPSATPAENQGLTQLAYGIANAARQVKADFNEQDKPVFLMVVQKNEDNVYDQHLLEVELQKQGIRTVRRTFEQLSCQLSSGDNQRLLLKDVGAVDVVYLRAGYQYSDYWAPELNESVCCHTLSQTRLFMEQHHVAMNATINQQLATSKTMQMLLTMMPAAEYARWGLTLQEAELVKSVLADMKPIGSEEIEWFNTQADKQEWVLKNQGEGGGHCVFGDDISEQLSQLEPEEYDAWALMQRLYPHERDVPTIAVRDTQQTLVTDLVSEVGLFTAYYQGEPVTELDGYAGYLIRSKPASENEGGIHSGKGILDSLVLID